MTATLGRVVHSDDFKRLLATPIRSRSAHFAVHFVNCGPGGAELPTAGSRPGNLSTDICQDLDQSVDNRSVQHWIGTVLPKRHARRSVTRNLLRRQIKVAVLRHAGNLPAGSWLIRLRQPFARAEFKSAGSQGLRELARTELDAMLAGAGR